MVEKYTGSQITNIDFPYRDLPYINFFQYPPLVKVDIDEITLKALLGLDSPNPSNPEFTIFVSIPYCRSRCNSCPFFKALLPLGDQYDILEDYLKYILSQTEGYAKTVRFSSQSCGAVYLGGGTASLLAPEQVGRLISAIQSDFALSPDIEITLEGNPRDFSRNYLQRVKICGVNRLSIGVQSFHDETLRSLNSPHQSHNSRHAIENALDVGFSTVNIDLLYGVPGQRLRDWESDLYYALNLSPESITIYSYVVHSGSVAQRLIERGVLNRPVNADKSYAWYIWASNLLKQRGYTEQMMGNFSKPGHEQKYSNLTYMSGSEFIGIGAGAYSFINGYQFSAVSDPELYKLQISTGRILPVDKLSVRISKRHAMERFVILNFLFSTLDRLKFRNRFGDDPLDVFPEIFSKLEFFGLIVIGTEVIQFTDLGKRWRANILYDFFAEEFKRL